MRGASLDDAVTPLARCECSSQIKAGTHPKKCECWCHPVVRAFFEALPAEDPHHLPTEQERKERRRVKVEPPQAAAIQMAWC
jgi:hypothetical protein